MDPTQRPAAPVEPLILSVSGRDRPGLLAELAGALAEADIAIVDIEQATLQDLLALSFLLDLGGDPAKSRHLLNTVIPRASGLGLRVDVRRLEPDRVRAGRDAELFVLTLVSGEPSSRLVAETAAAAARHGANIVSIRRLSETDLRAGEYVLDVSACPDTAALKADLLRTAEARGVDAGLAREDVYRKSKRIVVFDMDNTLVAGEMIDALASAAGVGERVAAITREAMEGRLEFAEALRRRVALLEGLPESKVNELAETMPLTPGAGEVLAVLKSLGYKLAVLSGGFTRFVDVLRARFGLDYAYANTLEIVGGVVTGRLVGDVLDGEGKARRLEEIARAEGVPRDQVVGVGDGANDIPMLQRAGLGIAFRAKEATRRSADGAIQRDSFEGLLYLLGVSARDRRRVQGDAAPER